MQLILTVLHLALAIGLVGLILIQHGRGADAGAAFGSGASSTVFGARGSASFLTRTTAVLATVFFLTSIALAYFAAKVGEPQGLMDDVAPPAAVLPDAPADSPVSDLPPGAMLDAPGDLPPAAADMPTPAEDGPAAEAGAPEDTAPAAESAASGDDAPPVPD